MKIKNLKESNPFTVTVKQKHIDNGVAYSGTFCPIALALRDIFDEKSCIISVEGDEVLIEFDGMLYYLEWEQGHGEGCMEDARKFIDNFDKDNIDKVKPQEFYMFLDYSYDIRND